MNIRILKIWICFGFRISCFGFNFMEQILLLLSKYFYYKPIELRKILEGFKNLQDVMEAPKDAFLKLEIGGKALDDFMENRHKECHPEGGLATEGSHRNYYGILRSAQNDTDIKIITILEANYPAALKNIYDPPPILFYKGNLDILKNNCLAVIGSRKASEYGKRAAEFFVRELSSHFTIVSGLAYGIDSLAHETAVKNQGAAAAVIGSGLDEKNIYPKSNIALAKKIIETGGLLLSEIPPGAGPQQFHFPMRNRIISGLSRGILIVEASEKSGTLITAKLGLEQGIDIFAVPGNIFSSTSAGVNYLIKFGAHPVTSAKDVLEFYGIENKNKKEYAPKNDLEKIIFESLGADGAHINDLANLTKTAIIDLIGTLTELEMEGVVKNIGGKYVKL